MHGVTGVAAFALIMNTDDRAGWKAVQDGYTLLFLLKVTPVAVFTPPHTRAAGMRVSAADGVVVGQLVRADILGGLLPDGVEAAEDLNRAAVVLTVGIGKRGTLFGHHSNDVIIGVNA